MAATSLKKAGVLALFLAVGALLLAARSLLAPEVVEAPGEALTLTVTRGDFERYCADVDVDPARIDAAARLHYFRAFLEQELLFRQALREGLVWRDPVVQRLVFSNQEFLGIERMSDALLDDMVENDRAIRSHVVRRARHLLAFADLPEPDDAELRRYHATHPDAFMSAARVDLSQRVYADRDSALQALATADPGAATALASGLPRQLDNADRRDIGRHFGYAFADAVLAAASAGAADGRWLGPEPSPFGFHLVRLANFRPAAVAAYGPAIHNRVRGAWLEAQREAAYRERLEQLQSRALVVFEDRAPMPFRDIAQQDPAAYYPAPT